MTQMKMGGFVNVLGLVALAVVVVTLGLLLNEWGSGSIGRIDVQQLTNSARGLKTYRSKIMKFSVLVPVDLTINENPTFVDLAKGQIKISISKNSTNFANVVDYVKDLDNMRPGIKVTGEKRTKIGGLDSLARLEESEGSLQSQKIYYIYFDYKVYSLSTNAKSLYNDLDQIAKSFKYIP